VKNVVFDFGKVVFRWEPYEFMPQLLPQRARDEASTHEIVTAFFEGYNGDWGEFDRGMIGVPELAQRIAVRTGLDLADVLRVVAAVPAELTPLPQTVALIQRLRERGHRLYFLSNMPAPFAAHLEAANPLGDWFDDGIFSSRVQMIKPDPAIFRAATERFGIDPRESMLIDDFRPNIVAARALGWNALHYLSHAQCEAELAAGGWISA
jgi:HAD superfamily hydrolase (TIGR01509 family)